MTSSKFLRQGSRLFPAVCLLLLSVTQPLWGQDQDVLQYEDARSRTRFEITVDKVHEVWLPVAVHVISSDQDAILRLEWHSVNEPLPEERVSFDKVEERYQCTIEDQRAR